MKEEGFDDLKTLLLLDFEVNELTTVELKDGHRKKQFCMWPREIESQDLFGDCYINSSLLAVVD